MTTVSAPLYRERTVIHDLKEKFMDIRKKYPGAGMLRVWIIFLGRLCSIFIRMAAAKYYLRKCTRIGHQVTVNGRPMIRNEGTLLLGDRVAIWSIFDRTKLLVHPDAKLTVDNGSRLNGVHISVKSCVRIGKNVRIGPYTLIMDSDFHDVLDTRKEGKKGDVEIEDNVWIASKVTILKGVKIGSNSIVAAGAVVTQDVPEDCIVAGVPAKIVRKIQR